MLSVVLAGIGLRRSQISSLWFSVKARPQQYATQVALLSGALSLITYEVFGWLVTPLDGVLQRMDSDVLHNSDSECFQFHCCQGFSSPSSAKVRTQISVKVFKTAGLLTMVNTTGAALGSLIAGFVLLPQSRHGEVLFRCFHSVMSVVAILVSDNAKEVRIRYQAPSHSNRRGSFLDFSCGRFRLDQCRSVSYQWEKPGWPTGRDGFLWLFAKDLQKRANTGKSRFLASRCTQYCSRTTTRCRQHKSSPDVTRSSSYTGRWPFTRHLKNALLICYGVGNTAQALTDTRDIESIDVVDISREIVDSSAIVFPDRKENPLNDPRVRIHIEDGRFFLQTSKNHYDLITGEPPPPLLAGVVNLYSQEYFQLMYDRLKEGGIVTYWLPVYQLTDSGARSILKAFCNVFEDCSLWNGYGFEWMLVGVRNAKGPVSEKDFMKQWSNPATARELARLGLEKPEQLGATFIMDAAALKEFTRDSLPVTDNYPKRISGFRGDAGTMSLQQYHSLLNTAVSRELFRSSPLVSSLWPQSIRSQTLDYFPVQGILNDTMRARAKISSSGTDC